MILRGKNRVPKFDGDLNGVEVDVTVYVYENHLKYSIEFQRHRTSTIVSNQKDLHTDILNTSLSLIDKVFNS